MSEPVMRSQQLSRAMMPALAVGAAGLALCALGSIGGHDPAADHHRQFFTSYLFAWIFWLGVSLGSMGILMMHHLLGGGWGLLIRRFGEAAALVTPLLAVLFIPILLGAYYLFPWADPAQVARDPVLQHKSPWLNWGFWSSRAWAYFVIWIVMALLMRTTPLGRPGVNATAFFARLRRVSAGGLVIYFFTMSLASVDWIMAREAHWYSTVFGFIVCVGQAVSAACFLIMMLWLVHDEPPFRPVVHPNYLNDLGNVLMTFVILWAYLSFAQLLVIWLGNMQREITWYLQRTAGGWRMVGTALILFHFLVPFIILLQRPLKRKAGRLAVIAAGIFIIHIIDELYWVTATGYPADSSVLTWLYIQGMNLVAFVGIGGLWIAAFLWILGRAPLIAEGEQEPISPVDHGHARSGT